MAMKALILRSDSSSTPIDLSHILSWQNLLNDSARSALIANAVPELGAVGWSPMSSKSLSFSAIESRFIPATSCARAPVGPPQTVWLSDCSSEERLRIVVADAA